MNRIYYLYLCSFPLVHAFAISGTINLSVLLSVLLFCFLLYEHRLFLNLQVWILVFFLLNMCVSLSVNSQSGDFKLISHSAAWITSVVLFFFVPLRCFEKINIKRVGLFLYWIFYVTIVYSIIEFIDVNYLNSGFVNLIPRPSVTDYDPIFVFGIRSRSFFVESGYFAMFVALYLPIICYFERGKLLRLKNIMLIILTIISMILAFSTTFFILCLFFLITFFSIKKRKNAILHIIIIIITISLFSVVYTLYKQEFDSFFDIIIFSKFESGSFSSRTSLNEESINYVLSNNSLLHVLFGYGPGSYNYLKLEAAISTYVNIFRDLGMLGLTLFLLFYFSVVLKLFNSKTVFSKYLLVSVCSSLIYLHTNTAYYYAFSWFIIVLSLNNEKVENQEPQAKHCDSLL